MNYRQHFGESITRYLEQLKHELDEDLPRINELIPDISLDLADTYISRVGGLLNTYHEVLHPNVRNNSGNKRTNWYARKKVLQEYDVKIEAALPGIFEKEGYVTAALIQQNVGIEEAEALKRLRSLSKKYKWRIKQDPQDPQNTKFSQARSTKSVNE